MKNKGLIIFIITILSIFVIILTIFMFGMINGNFRMYNISFNTKISKNLVIDETYNIEFGEVFINATSSNIHIKKSDDNNTKLVVYGKNKPIITTDNNKLDINYKEKGCIGFCINYTISKIELYLPLSYENDIYIINNYGDINIDEFNLNINIVEDYGDITIKGGNKLKVNSKYGDTHIIKANKLDIKSAAGDIKVENVNNIKAKNNYGDIKINNVLNHLDIQNNCGDIKIDNISLNENSTIESDYGDVKIKNTNQVYINAKTDLGDVKINNNYPKSDIELKIRNNCGDIKIDN